jgi:hypothetical protein
MQAIDLLLFIRFIGRFKQLDYQYIINKNEEQ